MFQYFDTPSRITTIRHPSTPCAPNSAFRSLICHLIHTMSIPLSLAGLIQNRHVRKHAPRTRFALATALHQRVSVSSQAAPLQAVKRFGPHDPRSTERASVALIGINLRWFRVPLRAFLSDNVISITPVVTLSEKRAQRINFLTGMALTASPLSSTQTLFGPCFLTG